MTQKRTFCPAQMESCLREVDTTAEKAGSDKQSRLKLRLLIEELLLIYRDALGEDSGFSVSTKEKQGDLCITINAEGEAFDPMV